ncbi:MAG TPA: hypothetical protein IGS53_11045 [Leptolyngbyaceae cyanobacterium M33_DOE_097]|nr:hypothetical protein [Leptolyngbyaceae cyanobacterium M33_DOE_097]
MESRRMVAVVESEQANCTAFSCLPKPLTGDNMARELAGRGIGHETHAENKAVYEV